MIQLRRLSISGLFKFILSATEQVVIPHFPVFGSLQYDWGNVLEYIVCGVLKDVFSHLHNNYNNYNNTDNYTIYTILSTDIDISSTYKKYKLIENIS